MDALTRRGSNADTDPAPLSRDAWLRVLERVLLSRQLDGFEEQLVPRREVYYQFSARGHEVSQCLLGEFLDHPADGLAVYYRSRPLMLSLGLEPDAALAATMMRAGSMSEGRDIGVVFNRPGAHGQPTVLPACGGVGAQYTPAVGWAQALLYRQGALGESGAAGAIAVVHGGDGSTATNGFWSALNIATTQQLPLLFFIEDNGFGISVPSTLQTPDGDICENLSGFGNLSIFEADAAAPAHAAAVIAQAVRHVRAIRCWRCGACWCRPRWARRSGRRPKRAPRAPSSRRMRARARVRSRIRHRCIASASARTAPMAPRCCSSRAAWRRSACGCPRAAMSPRPPGRASTWRPRSAARWRRSCG